jgi:hypothetical protein
MQRKETEGEERGDRSSCRGRKHKVQIGDRRCRKETGGAGRGYREYREETGNTERERRYEIMQTGSAEKRQVEQREETVGSELVVTDIGDRK